MAFVGRARDFVGAGRVMPHVTVELINKYLTDMKLAGLL